ncbi:MAG TPA: HDIG domain-containing protein [Firmicutes bacterium]|nr:HDIG domain-containing protein [Candidatus Fermentithermobacillaceae bacterium]
MFRKQAEKTDRTKHAVSSGRPGTGSSRGNKNDLKGLAAKLKPYSHVLIWATITFVVIFAIFLISLVPPQVELKAGEVSPIDVKATKEVVDEAATEELRAERVAGVSEVYDSNPRVLDETRALFQELALKIKSLAATEDLSTQDIVRELRPFVSDSVSDTDIIGVVATSPVIVEGCINRAQEVVEDILSRGLKSENLEKGKEEAVAKIVIDGSIPDQVARVIAGFIDKNLEANLILNKEETDKKIRQALASVESVKIRRDEFIVRKGEVVTENHIVILEKLGIMGTRVRFSQISGAFLIALLFCGFTGVYLVSYYTHMLTPKNTALLASVVMLSILALKALAGVSGFLAPVSFGVMLSATLIDRRFGAFFGAGLALAVGVMTGFEVKYVALALTSGIASALAVRKVWNRSQLFRAGLVVTAVAGVTYACLGLTGAMAMDDVSVWREVFFVLANGPLSAVLAVGSLPIFESVFGLLTPIRLIELSNPEHPLLHRLLLEAPGTYHHSIMVGNLAEAAAWAIGADSLLARVGAYYHDIGKIKRPYLFVENQVFDMGNPHDKMSPSLSSTAIKAHVKDGVELAEEHEVPKAILNFISEHHGTTLAMYFYLKASENAAARDDRPPEEWSFRYEGPRPGSKETAIVMLADSVEAATRSISKPTPARIESVVRKIIHDRLFDHQLDRSDLTLRELDTIAETFIQVLAGLFHTRIQYPKAKGRNGADKPNTNDGAGEANGG